MAHRRRGRPLGGRLGRRAVRAAAQHDEVVGCTLTGLAPLADVPRLLRGRQRVVRRTAGAAVGVLIAVFCAGYVWIAGSAYRGGRCRAPLVLVGEGSYGLVMIASVFLLPHPGTGLPRGITETFADGLPSVPANLPVDA